MRGGMIQGLLATLQESVIINLGTRRKRLLTRVEGGWVCLSAYLLPQIYKPHFLSFTVYLHLMKHIVLFFLHVISIGSTVSLFVKLLANIVIPLPIAFVTIHPLFLTL